MLQHNEWRRNKQAAIKPQVYPGENVFFLSCFNHVQGDCTMDLYAVNTLWNSKWVAAFRNDINCPLILKGSTKIR